MTYIVQKHGEWSEMPDVIDEDFEAETLEEAERIIRTEIPVGCIYLLYDDDVLVREGTG